MLESVLLRIQRLERRDGYMLAARLSVGKVIGDLLFHLGAWGLAGRLRNIEQLSHP